MSIIVKWKDGTQTEYVDANNFQGNGVQGFVGKRDENGVIEVIAAIDMNEIAGMPEEVPCVEK